MKGIFSLKFRLIPDSSFYLGCFFFSQEPYEGMLCQNFFNSQKCILSSMKYFRLRSHEGTLCQNFFQSQKRILPSIKYFSLRSYEGIVLKISLIPKNAFYLV